PFHVHLPRDPSPAPQQSLWRARSGHGVAWGVPSRQGLPREEIAERSERPDGLENLRVLSRRSAGAENDDQRRPASARRHVREAAARGEAGPQRGDRLPSRAPRRLRVDRLPRAVPRAVGAAARDGGAGDPAAARDRGARGDDRFFIAAHRGAHQYRSGLARVADLPAPRQLPHRAPPLRLGAALQPARPAPRDGGARGARGGRAAALPRHAGQNLRRARRGLRWTSAARYFGGGAGNWTKGGGGVWSGGTNAGAGLPAGPRLRTYRYTARRS